MLAFLKRHWKPLATVALILLATAIMFLVFLYAPPASIWLGKLIFNGITTEAAVKNATAGVAAISTFLITASLAAISTLTYWVVRAIHGKDHDPVKEIDTDRREIIYKNGTYALIEQKTNTIPSQKKDAIQSDVFDVFGDENLNREAEKKPLLEQDNNDTDNDEASDCSKHGPTQ